MCSKRKKYSVAEVLDMITEEDSDSDVTPKHLKPETG